MWCLKTWLSQATWNWHLQTDTCVWRMKKPFGRFGPASHFRIHCLDHSLYDEGTVETACNNSLRVICWAVSCFLTRIDVSSCYLGLWTCLLTCYKLPLSLEPLREGVVISKDKEEVITFEWESGTRFRETYLCLWDTRISSLLYFFLYITIRGPILRL